MVSHPENTTVHKLLGARSHKGCIVAGSNPALATQLLHNQFLFLPCGYERTAGFLNKGTILAKEISYINCIKKEKYEHSKFEPTRTRAITDIA